MKHFFGLSFEVLYQVVALIVIVILVHAAYVGIVRPRGDAILAQQAAALQLDKSAAPERSIYVLIYDWEQEAAIILALWALAIMGFKWVMILRQRALLGRDFIPLAEGVRILPDDTRELARQVQALPEPQRRALLPRALLAGLQRFQTTRSVQDVATAVHAYCEAEGERQESELAMIRYIAWAIPSIGFLGTVRGIGDALSQAHQAIEGDIFGVTRSLGVAFNSTLIALLVSLLLMFILHQLQLLQERFILDAEEYCEEKLTQRLHAT
ncbi:MAG: MotA/TolQ/ExbB proton channel family protein [Desulfobacterales bacterium]|jgi:biopolymer transport protein ExbB/TolQ|nr:MotA/TolQ/ExbB proton channel family protein [Desulfobacterales bacterium]